MMLKWAKDLIIGTSVTGKSAGIMKKLDAGETVTMYFLITLTRGADQLEIINTAYLAQKHVRENLPTIIGIAGSKPEAKQMVEGLVAECYEATGGADLKGYLQDRI
jgi:hypothetical protein